MLWGRAVWTAWLLVAAEASAGTVSEALRSSDCVHGLYLNGLGHAWTGFCSCQADWAGPTCALPRCYNGGRPNVLESTNQVGCECLRRFFGTHCQIPVCDGGFVEGAECRCFRGFHGAFCQHRCVYGRWTDQGCLCHDGFQPPDCAKCLPARYGPACQEPGLLRRLAFSGIVLAGLSTLAASLLCCVWQNTRRVSALPSPEPGPAAPLLPPPPLRAGARASASAHQLPPPSYHSSAEPRQTALPRTSMAPLNKSLGPPPSYSEAELAQLAESLGRPHRDSAEDTSRGDQRTAETSS